MKNLIKYLVSLAISASTATSVAAPVRRALPIPAPSAPAVARPPQFVMVGFDGGLNLNQWQAIRDFAKGMRAASKPINMTAFVSSVYFVNENNRKIYLPPHHSPGASAIGFGGKDNQAIADRVDQMNAAFGENHEIASHLNGHFDASVEKWSPADWATEFRQYETLFFGAFFNNKIQPNRGNRFQQGYAMDKNDVAGFRAPMLGVTPGLFPALKDHGFVYDASTTAAPSEWPVKDATGVWKFPLPVIPLAGTAKRVVLMDYNFFMMQSKAVNNLPQREFYRKQMLTSYMNYFSTNYNGNRAPVFIGHHFANYNGGAYWDALKDFTTNVCGMPEVKCITFKQYAQWLDSVSGNTLAAYRANNFPALNQRKAMNYAAIVNRDVQLKLATAGDTIQVLASGEDYDDQASTVVVKVNGQKINPSLLKTSVLRRKFPKGANVEVSASIIDEKGVEIQRATHELKALGTEDENFTLNPEENRLQLGDLPEAHKEDLSL